MVQFDLNEDQRELLIKHVFDKIEFFYNNTESFSTTPTLDVHEIRNFIKNFDLQKAVNYKDAIDHVTKGIERYTVHTPHPKYFGLFNPRANFAGILADLIVAGYNPQLAAWSHSPFASETEAELIKEFGLKFGYKSDLIDGVFSTGGAEANLTALLCALNHAIPDVSKNGVFGMSKRPMIYCSEEAHHSINKAAKTVGLGYLSVQSIPSDDALKIDIEILKDRIQNDLVLNHQPFMIVGTAGTTGAGTIDDLQALRNISDEFGLWFHVDAAYGGAAILSDELKPHLKGIECSDSITFDAHKWMSVPMATSLFITSHKEILSKTFRITTEYMPKEGKDLDIVDPFAHSIQWSRRFIGLKVYLSLLFFGWEGYEQIIDHQAKMGNMFRKKLVQNKWRITNDTPLPVICFTEDTFASDANFTGTILQNIIKDGKFWISVYPIRETHNFRVCMTNYNTSEHDLDALIEALNKQRRMYQTNNKN